MHANKYLELYNALSGALWGVMFLRLLISYPLLGSELLSESMAGFVSWVQLGALFEVFHSALGLVRSSIVTTSMQVASRVVLIWGVVRLFPQVAAVPAFSLMVLAWSITETIRYPYYWYGLRGAIPHWLELARYNAFIILYPVGASSEAYLIYRALPYAAFLHPYYELFLKALLIIYPPSFYILFSHMFRQRRKVLQKFRDQSKKKTN